MHKQIKLTIMCIGLTALLTGCSQKNSDLILTGSVEGEQLIVSSQLAGTVTQVLVNSGDVVKDGALLLQLDDRELALQMEKLEIARQIAELQYKDLKNGASKALIRQQIAARDQLKVQLAGSAKELSYLQKQLADAKALVSSGATATTKTDELLQQIERETTKYKGINEQVKAAQAQLSQTLEGVVDEKLQQSLLQINLKDKEIEQAAIHLEQAKILSPKAGVVQTVNYEVGELVMPGQKLLSIIDESDLELKVYVTEKDLNRIALGQKVKLLPAFDMTTPPEAVISYIASKAEFTPKNIESKESKQEMVFEVRIQITDPSHLIKPGMYIDVNLERE